MKFRILFTLVASLFLGMTISAQSVSWVVKPGMYDAITHYTSTLFKVSKDGRLGVINAEGREVVPVECSEITDFYEGYALALVNDRGQHRVLGILSDSGDYASVSDGRYYTMPNQEFVSEGFVTVINDSRYAAFMNVHGVVEKVLEDAVGFWPFSGGYALVEEDDDYYFLDKNLRRNDIAIETNYEFTYATNTYNNEAYIWVEDKCYKYNVATGKNTRVKDTSRFEDAPLDYLGCYRSVTGRTNVPYDTKKTSSPLFKSIRQEGKYGFERNGETLLSCQLEEVGDICGDVAVIRLDGRAGMLKMNPSSESFAVVTSKSIFDYYKGEEKELLHTFSLTLPAEWRNAQLAVSLTNADGGRFALEGKDGIYTFKTAELTGDMTYNVEVESEGLKLWRGQFACNYTAKQRPVQVIERHNENNVSSAVTSPLTVTVRMKNTMADKSGRCYVVATITNPNAKAVTTNVSFSGSELLNKAVFSVSIPPHGSREVSSFFTVKKVAKGQSVTVTSSAGGRTTLTNLVLKP